MRRFALFLIAAAIIAGLSLLGYQAHHAVNYTDTRVFGPRNLKPNKTILRLEDIKR